jgi:hypothetical protein
MTLNYDKWLKAIHKLAQGNTLGTNGSACNMRPERAIYLFSTIYLMTIIMLPFQGEENAIHL